ncbi:MAG: transporter substrate-binding domain-containing protein [Agarilytica sp.]
MSANNHISGGEGFSFTQEEMAWLKQHKQIRVAFDGYFPPYSFLNENGEVEGFAADIFKLMEVRLGIQVDVHAQYHWNAIYKSAQEKKVDVVASMVQRPERAEWFLFSEPYIHKSLVVIAREDDERFNVRNDIQNKSIALVRGYQYVEKILDEFPSLQPVYVDTMIDALNAVSVGSVDAAISFLGAGHYYRNKYLLSNLKYAAIFDKKSANESIAIRKDWPEFASILNKFVKNIPERKLQEMRDRWLPVEYMENLVDVHLTEEELAWINAHPKIRLGVDPEFAPFEFIENGKYLGMVSDYIKILSLRLNINMEVVPNLTWDEAVNKVKKKELDVLPAVGKTEQREKFLGFTQPYLNFHRVIVSRLDSPFISGLNDLDGMSVAVQNRTSHHGFVEENTALSPALYNSLQETLLAVSGGEADAMIGNVASATYWIRKLNLSNLKIAAPVSMDVQSLHFSVRKDWPQLVSILEKGLQTFTPRQHKRISEKWLTVEYNPEVNFGYVWKLLVAAGVALVLFALWNIMLNRKVRLRTSQLSYSANYDRTTDLPNRFLMLDRLSQSIAEAKIKKEKLAVLSVDLNEFKKINDNFGHHAGDRLLKDVAFRLKGSFPNETTVGRMGGDQFLIIVSHVEDAADMAVLAENILAELQGKFVIGGEELVLTSSLGISMYPGDGEDAETLLQNADSAVHFSKANKRGGYAFYTKDLIELVSRRVQLEQCMLGALERGEFEVFYQPKVDTNSRKIVSFEALLRWFSRDLGEVSPVEFIPIAEKNGMIEPIGEFVLDDALKRLKDWTSAYDPNFTVAVNLSPIQFYSQNLVIKIEKFLAQSSLSSRALELEITEGVLLTGSKEVEKTLKKLESLNVTLTMDDFGTGYSSMSYLRKFNFDTIKIDREFIMDLPGDYSDKQLVSATVAMAHGLGMNVIAEGVETEDQYAFLLGLECDVMQGWLFSKALPVNEITKILQSGSHFL